MQQNDLSAPRNLTRSRRSFGGLELAAWPTAWRLGYGRELFRHFRTHGSLPGLAPGALNAWFALAAQTAKRVQRMKNRWRGQTVVCVGNGPSINRTDLELLNNQPVIGTNRAFMALDRFRTPDFCLLVQDNYRLAEIEREIARLCCPIFIGNCLFDEEHVPSDWLSNAPANVSFYMPKFKWHVSDGVCYPEPTWELGFSTNPICGVYYGYSVIFSAIQFAYFTGAKRIVCVGVDMDFSAGTSFVPGVRHQWPEFNYDVHCKPMFQMFREFLATQGVELINATPGGRVDEIRRMDLADALPRTRAA